MDRGRAVATLVERFKNYGPSFFEARLERMRLFACAFGNPESTYPIVHVAGSNGKGSVSWKIAQCLQLTGYRVGLYTSPHIHDFEERVRINGAPISSEEFAEGAARVLQMEKNFPIQLVFFDILTLIAWNWFAKNKVDIAIIEAGLGGRKDSTNIITPILSVITSISLEHTHILGETLEAVAREKYGIIKRGVPVVVGAAAQVFPIKEIALDLHAPLHAVETSRPHYDLANQATAALALQVLAPRFRSDPKGLATRPPCRFELVGKCLLDVAHNPDAFSHLIQALKERFPQQAFRFIIGMCQDKDYASCLRQVAEVAEHIYLVPLETIRSATVEQLAESLIQVGYERYTSCASVTEAIEQALQSSAQVVVTGSFSLMKAASLPLFG